MDPLARLFERYRKRGDLRALGKVFDQLAPRLLKLALHLCSEPADAEDAVQHAFVLAMRRAETFDSSRRLEPWLAGLLTNAARNAQRRAVRRSAEPLVDVAGDDDGGPPAAAERGELVAMLRTQVDALPPEQRRVLLLQLQHGLSAVEIAEVLDEAPGTVRMRLHRGLQSLRRLLPAALASGVFGVLPTRGLAAVRREVMRVGKEQIVVAGAPAAALAIGGVLVMKKLLLVIGLVGLAGAWWWSTGATVAAAPAALVESASAAVPVVAVGGGTEPLRTAVEALPERLPAAAASGSLRLRVVARGLDLPFVGTWLQIWPGEVAAAPFDATLVERATDAAGEVLLRDCAPGPWQVLLVAEYDAEPQRVEVLPGCQAELQIECAAERAVRGVVVDAGGTPVPGAEIWVHRQTYMGRYGLSEPPYVGDRRVGVSDHDGRFQVAVARREQTIGARKEGHGPSFGRFLHDRSEASMELRLGRLFATVSGTVRDAAGQPVAGAFVQARLPDDTRRDVDGTLLAGWLPPVTRTDAHGRFRLDSLPPGTYPLWASADPFRGRTEVSAASFGHTGADITMVDGVFVVGTVRTADGTPVPDLVVAARTKADPRAGHFVQSGTRDDGSYGLPCVQASKFVVTVERRFTVIAFRQIEAAAPGVLRCDFVMADLQALRGRVVDDAGRPLAGWRVHATDDRDAEQQAFASTDRAGRFELCVAGERRFKLAARPPLATEDAVERTGVRCGDSPIELPVPADRLPIATVSGRLVDCDGRAVAGREVVLERQRHFAFARSDAGGHFRLQRIPAGVFELRLGTNSQARRLADGTLARGQQLDLGDLAASYPATLRVEITRADGSPWQGALPSVRLLDAVGQWIDVDRETNDGVQVLHAPAGPCRVEIRDADLIALPQQTELVAGETRTLRIPVTIGRSRDLVFNGEGDDKLQSAPPLHLRVRQANGEVVVDEDVESSWSVRGFRYWSFRRVYPFGRYEVEAFTDGSQRYGASFEVRGDLGDPTRVDVPAIGR